MWLGLVQAILEPIKFEHNVEHQMRCLLQVIDSRLTASQIGILVFSPGNFIGSNIFDTSINKLHEVNKFPIFYVTTKLMLLSSVPVHSIIVFINKDNLIFLNYFLLSVMQHISLKADKNLIIVTNDKTSNCKSAFNYAMDILQVTWDFSNDKKYLSGGRFQNTIVLIGRHNPNIEEPTSIDVFGWIPQEQTDPCVKSISKVKLFDTWNSLNNSFVNNADLFPNKKINNFCGCSMKIQLLSVEYLLLYLSNYNFDPTVSPVYSAMKEISTFSNFNFSVIRNVTVYTYLYTFYGNCEIAVLLLYNSDTVPSMLNKFDPIFMQNERVKVYVPLGAPIPNWQGLIRIFSLQIWIPVITVYFLISFIRFLLKRRETEESMITSVLYTLQMSLGMPISMNTKSRIFLALMILFVFYFMVIYTIYRA